MRASDLAPLPYHRAVVDHLRARCPGAWQQFASDTYGAAQSAAARLDLLKSTYALARESHPAVYAVADEVAGALGLGVPVSLYQGADGPMNAELVFVPDAAAVVFHGPLTERLDADELQALLAHELAHHRLWRLDGGDYLTAQRLLVGLLGGQVQRSVAATLRLYTLATELFADRAALRIGSGLDAPVRLLVKVETGVRDVVAADFVAQAAQIYAASGDGTVGWTHPEAHVRALALAWFAADGDAADDRIRRLVEGPIALNELDLLRREALTAWTRRLVDHLLGPSWLRTDARIGLARRMFDDYAPAPVVPLEELRAGLTDYGETVRDFAAFVLVDFVAVDPAVADLGLAHAHAVALGLGLETRLERELQKKLKRTKRSIQDVVARRDALLAAAAMQADS